MKILDLLFPKRCCGCGKVGSHFCPTCIGNILQKDLFCPYCGHASIGGATHPLLCLKKYDLDGLWSLGLYEGVLAKAIIKLKYRFNYEIAQSLIDLIFWYFQKKEVKFWDNDWVITPVPLHSRREKWRGFNQAALLGKLLSKKLNIEYAETLIRTRYTKPQVKLSRYERKNNTKDAFSLNAQFEIRNLHFLLIDDVYTTGSTLKECCKVLKRNGAGKVWALTLAC